MTEPTLETSTWDALFESLGRSFDNVITPITLIFFLALVAILVPLLVKAWRIPSLLRRHLDAYLGVGIGESTIESVRRQYLSMSLRDPIGDSIRDTLSEYDRALVERRHRGPNSESRMFESDRLLAECRLFHALPFGVVQLSPGIFTALGLLGTFFGVSFALGFLRIGETELHGSMDHVIAGLASAFWTSIFGVGLSILSGFVGRIAESRVEHSVAEANQRLQETFELRTQEGELASVASIIGGLPRQITDKLESFTERLFAPALEKAAEQGTRAAREYAEHFAEVLSKKLSGLIEEAGRRTAQSLEESATQAARHIRAVGDQLQSTGNQVAEQLRAAGSGIQDGLKEVSKLADSCAKVSEATLSASMSSQGLLQTSIQLSSSITERMKEMNASVADLKKVETQIAKRHKNVDTVVQTIEGAATSFTVAVEGSNTAVERSQALTEAVDRLVTRVEVLSIGMTQNLAKVAEASDAISQLPSTMERLRERLSELEEQLAETSSRLADGVHQNQEGFNTLRTTLQQYTSDLQRAHTATEVILSELLRESDTLTGTDRS